MTTSKNHTTSGEFKLDHYRFYRNERSQLVFVPSGPDVDGYLAMDQEENNFVQIRLLKTEDPARKQTYKATWKQIRDQNDCGICPEILAYGEEDSVPYYVSSLPAGEPVSYFVKRGGPVPPEVAVKLVLKLVRSLRAQNPVSYETYEMFAETLWITRSADEPRIILGDFSPVPRDGAEAANTLLCLDLLKYLSGNPPFNEIFQTLISEIENGPATLEFFVTQLEKYAQANPVSDFWTDFNQPNPLLHQLVDPHVAMQSVIPDSPTETIERMPCDRPLWQYILGIGSSAIFFGILAMIGLIFMTKERPVPVAKANPKITKPVPEKRPDLAESSLKSFPVPLPPETDPESVVVVEKPDLPLAKPLPPVPVGDTVDEVTTKPLESLADPGKVDEIALDKPKPVEPAIVDITPGIELPVLPQPPAKPETPVDIFDQLAGEAALARADNEPVKAIDKEIDLLRMNPKSVDAKLRLNSDLTLLQQTPDRDYTNKELETLKKTTVFNPKAYDILVMHYRNTGNWNYEIDTLVKLGRTGRSDKLSEAGERMFQNPNATEGDRTAARGYFIEAAELGESSAQFFAGECMVFGRGGSKDLPRGTYYLRKAIDQGDARAMDLLGVCYVRGWGVTRNDERAVELFQAAIDGGNIPAYYNLGARYAQGQGVERDPAKAAQLFETGSSKGNAHCMLVYARCLEAGYGKDRDLEKAKYWYSKSAEKGNPEAIEWCSENNLDYLKFLADS